MSNDQSQPFSSDDEQMDAAINRAKSTINQFIDAFCNPTDEQTSFLLKVVFDEGDHREHIWLADIDFSGNMPSGVVANEPNLPSLTFMQRVQFDPSTISDWMYVDSGRLIGGYTTRVIRDRMTAEHRTGFDARSPYKF